MKKENTRIYNNQRVGGVWLIYIGIVIILSALMDRELLIQPVVLGVGFGVGYFIIYGLPFIKKRLSYGKDSKFQERMDNLSVFGSVILCTFVGIWIGFDDARFVWLLILLIIGLHFLGFYFSLGKYIVILGLLSTLNALAGLILVNVPFLVFALIDGLLKIGFGIKLVSLIQKPSTI